ncbi:hypothetical protein K504DRAFT_450403 [Pleomassaria siparia CBS 279.74]|uniref:Nucleotide-diphospho-sugar transferase domain-containing protein n=1 Tax=Pleomassaria siparia CBS 279.74 TaxID=1314801 RepID=A0A6G1KN53_9PLEO|nr:hypothetical protein K504DRAFT_450403 [Pleomassaria siparia CBS 279.74]
MMLPSTGARSTLALATTAGIVLIFMFGVLAWRSPPRLSFPSHADLAAIPKPNSSPIAIQDIIRSLFEPLKIPVNQPDFVDEDGIKFSLPEKIRFNKGLGNKVLILDLDTRPLKSTDDYNRGEFDWRKINHVSGGVFNHYTYSLIHGYDYKFIQASNFKDRHPTWIKPSALANHIKNYDFIIFLDADATFRFMHLPIEWMLNYWNIEKKHSITMSLDPWDPKEPGYNSDRFNRTYTNTGFMAVQNNDEIMPILKAWHECPDDTRYANCSEWKMPKFHEQSAFGEYIRYDYEDNIKELPCAEANGFPGVVVSNCVGKFIRHYWFDKSAVKQDFRDNVMQAISLPIQGLFADPSHGVVTMQKENVIS